jgi:hypothetical protein
MTGARYNNSNSKNVEKEQHNLANVSLLIISLMKKNNKTNIMCREPQISFMNVSV